jgi:hypothetical protein
VAIFPIQDLSAATRKELFRLQGIENAAAIFSAAEIRERLPNNASPLDPCKKLLFAKDKGTVMYCWWRASSINWAKRVCCRKIALGCMSNYLNAGNAAFVSAAPFLVGLVFCDQREKDE